MASSLPSFCSILVTPSRKYYTHHQSLQVRAHFSTDEGRSRSIVDANLRVLKERIEEVRIKERLERCCTSGKYGWNYAPHGYNYKHKREASLSNYIQLIGWVGGTSGLMILSGTAFLSLVIHANARHYLRLGCQKFYLVVFEHMIYVLKDTYYDFGVLPTVPDFGYGWIMLSLAVFSLEGVRVAGDIFFERVRVVEQLNTRLRALSRAACGENAWD
ncbi:hypothetical protein LguiA_005930 [Lonicera macranthoides]